MKLSFNISEAGFTPESIDTKATINLDTSTGTITDISLETTAVVPGLSTDKFLALAQDAKANCPVSKVLNANITLNAQLTERAPV